MSIDPKLFELTADVLEIFFTRKKKCSRKNERGHQGMVYSQRALMAVTSCASNRVP